MSDFAEASGTPLLSLPPRTDTFFINLVFKSMAMMLTWTNALYEDCKQARKKNIIQKGTFTFDEDAVSGGDTGGISASGSTVTSISGT